MRKRLLPAYAASEPEAEEEVSTSHGQFVWYELMTKDAAAATAFYRTVVGWDARGAGPGMGDPGYVILSAGDVGVGGLMELPQAARDAGARPGWTGYVAVGDVDAYAERVTAAGGSICHGPDDIPGVGRFAVVADPQGAGFVLFTPREGMEGAPSAAGTTPGRIGWHELHAADPEAAFAFYAGLFGWTKADALDMGPMGTYQLFATGGQPVGGMMARQGGTSRDGVPRPAWLFYFVVDGVDAALARAQDAGAQLLQGPHEVPGGSWIAHLRDPQGVVFAVTGPKG